MNIYTHSSFEDGAKEQVVKGDFELYDFIESQLKERIPAEHYYKLNLKIKEFKGKYKRSSIENNGELNEEEYIAKTGSNGDPYNCEIRLNYFDIKRVYQKERYFGIAMLKGGMLKSVKDTYYYILLHELGHIVNFYNYFDEYVKFINNEAEDIFSLEDAEERVAGKLGDRLYADWLEERGHSN